MVASSSVCGMNWNWYPCEDQKCLSTDRKRGRFGYLVGVSLLIIIRRESNYPIFVSRVIMSALVSDWITSRKNVWRRTTFINFCYCGHFLSCFWLGIVAYFGLLGSLSLIYRIYLKGWKISVDDGSFLFTCSDFNFPFYSIGPFSPKYIVFHDRPTSTPGLRMIWCVRRSLSIFCV